MWREAGSFWLTGIPGRQGIRFWMTGMGDRR